jgi:hypothetical protein
VEQSRLRVLEPTFFINGAEVGGVRGRALGPPTHPLVHRGAWRLAAQGAGREGGALHRPYLQRTADSGIRRRGAWRLYICADALN